MRSAGELAARAVYKAYPQSLPQDTFISVLDEVNKQVAQLLLDGHIVKLPYRLGELYVEKRKVNYEKLHLDYGHWQKTGGERIYHLNRHSDGYHAYFHWKKISCNVIHKGLYKFIPARGNSRKLAQVMLAEGGHKVFAAYERPENQ